MLLQRLADFHERIEDELEPRHHKKRKFAWLIELSPEGEFKGFIKTAEKKSNQEFAVPYLRRCGPSPPPYLLVDTPAYTLGLGLDKMSDEKAAPRHESFTSLTEECANSCEAPEMKAIVKFLRHNVGKAKKECPSDISSDDLIGFSINGVMPIRNENIQNFWINKMDASASEKSNMSGQCMVCGKQEIPIADRPPVELQLGPDRVQLITANENAFESYGLNASETGPVCFKCSHIYGRALRYLLGSDQHSLRIASTTHVYWTRQREDFNPWTLVSDPRPQDVGELLKSAFRSKGVPDINSNDFYLLSVSAYTSRLVVRNWLETTVKNVRQNLFNYFIGQQMVGTDGDDSYFPLRTLALSLARSFDSIPVQAEDELLACAIEGQPLSNRILNQAVRRARADSDYRMTRPRAGLIRLVLESQRLHGLIKEENRMMPELDRENGNPAYLCGRLLAVLERIQKTAIGSKATIVDRYFGTASSAPATVFGNLMRGAQNHLSKLRKEKKGAFYALDRQMQEICSHISEFPRTLSLQDQATFSLGYYQQKAADSRAAAERTDNSSR